MFLSLYSYSDETDWEAPALLFIIRSFISHPSYRMAICPGRLMAWLSVGWFFYRSGIPHLMLSNYDTGWFLSSHTPPPFCKFICFSHFPAIHKEMLPVVLWFTFWQRLLHNLLPTWGKLVVKSVSVQITIWWQSELALWIICAAGDTARASPV